MFARAIEALLRGAVLIAACASAATAHGADLIRVCNGGAPAGSGTCPSMPPLGAGSNEWGCTKDAESGLLWELKMSGTEARGRDKTFTNFSAAYNPGKELGTAIDATGFANAVNARGLCGASDWRLPSRFELMGLVDYGAARPKPSIDAAYFPDLPEKKRVYWAASGYAGDPSNAWGVDFTDGVAGDDNRNIYYAVRLVSGPRRTAEFAVSADGQEVTDQRAKLVWRRCAEGMSWNGSACSGTPGSYTFDLATAHAKERAGASRSAWRLPSIKELISIVDDGRVDPAIDLALFPATPATWFWSSTPSVEHPAYLWTVQFGPGHVGHHGYRHDRHALRLVRAVR